MTWPDTWPAMVLVGAGAIIGSLVTAFVLLLFKRP